MDSEYNPTKWVRQVEGCLKNSYHITALHNAGDCDACIKLLSRAYMQLFNVKSHVEFGEV